VIGGFFVGVIAIHERQHTAPDNLDLPTAYFSPDEGAGRGRFLWPLGAHPFTLTREAIAQYFRYLKPEGVLAVHMTNRFLNLRPVVKTAAKHFGKEVRLVDSEGIPEKLVLCSRWAPISSDAAFFKDPRLNSATTIADPNGFQPWKDGYSSVFPILK